MRGKKLTDLYLDLHNGISGDMAVAALLSLGGNMDHLREMLASVDLHGYEIQGIARRRNGIPGIVFRVRVEAVSQPARSYEQIRSLIKGSGLGDAEKNLAQVIFANLAQAEAEVHGTEPAQVHFHELGGVDSIVDVVGFSVLYTALGVRHCRASSIHLGSGSTASMHGEIPVPAPATVELVKGLPVCGTGVPFELTTPTGAAIVKSVVDSFGPLPECVIQQVGTGFGGRKSPGINALRVFTYREPAMEEKIGDLVAVIDVSIDDSTPEEMSFLQERLFSSGAFDVFTTPIYMKKNRPAFGLTVICAPGELDRLAGVILRESSTFGLRYRYSPRMVLGRRIETVPTSFGPISVKIGLMGDVPVKASFEYDELRKAALAHGVPLGSVLSEARTQTQARFPFMRFTAAAGEIDPGSRERDKNHSEE
jgi:uncharacterized protein (TIGR00299 family) protein